MRRLILAATVAATLIAGLVPATVAAAPVMTFGHEGSELMLRSHCIAGMAPGNAAIHVVWKRASGAVKAIVDVTSASYGLWQYCSASKTLAVGDTIRASTGSHARTFTMPRVTLVASRVGAGSFSGRGPANQTGDLYFRSGIFGDYEPLTEVTTNGQGFWSLPDADVIGGINASVYWLTAQGDRMAAYAMVPYVHVTIDQLRVSGGSLALSDVVVDVRDPSTNALRARLSTTTDEWGIFWRENFQPQINGARPRIGDRVVSQISADLDWHVPNIEATADVVADTVSGYCHSTEFEPFIAAVHVFRTGHERGYAHADVSASGAFEADFNYSPAPWYEPANLKHGDRILVDCYSQKGDIVSRNFITP